MSRIGKKPIAVPDKVQVTVTGSKVTVKGPQGELVQTLPGNVRVQVAGKTVSVERADDSQSARAAHGMARTVVANMISGAATGFTKVLAIQGVGFRAELRGKNWILFSLGFSHPILYEIPPGVTVAIDAKENTLRISGADKQLVGATAAEIRAQRPPEPYKGKGIRYSDETVRMKEGKAGGK